MENIVYNELLFRGYKVDIGEIEIAEKNKSGKISEKRLEVDFVINKGSKRYYIQSAYDMPTEQKKQQEEKSLLSIKDSFKKIIIIQGTAKPYYDDNGIMIIGLKNFLLDFNSLDL